jgi:hypothetical protein
MAVKRISKQVRGDHVLQHLEIDPTVRNGVRAKPAERGTRKFTGDAGSNGHGRRR